MLPPDLPLMLSPQAEDDFADILQYTLETWGENQVYVIALYSIMPYRQFNKIRRLVIEKLRFRKSTELFQLDGMSFSIESLQMLSMYLVYCIIGWIMGEVCNTDIANILYPFILQKGSVN
jgi:hypothetical protein